MTEQPALSLGRPQTFANSKRTVRAAQVALTLTQGGNYEGRNTSNNRVADLNHNRVVSAMIEFLMNVWPIVPVLIGGVIGTLIGMYCDK